MALIFNTPKISLQDLKRETSDISYQSDFFSKLYNNLQELSRHYLGVNSYEISELQKVQLFPLFNNISALYEELDAVISSNISVNPDKLDVLKRKLVNIIQDLITFLDDNNLADRSVGDMDVTSGEEN